MKVLEYGKQIGLENECASGIQGSLYVYFQDWNNQGRTGILDFEGHKMKLGSHQGEGQWVVLYYSRRF